MSNLDTSPLEQAIAAFRTAHNNEPTQSALRVLNDLQSTRQLFWVRAGAVIEPCNEFTDLIRRMQRQ